MHFEMYEETTKATRKSRICQHGKFQPYCKQCKGSMLCTHLRHKNRCAVCKRLYNCCNVLAYMVIVDACFGTKPAAADPAATLV